jgi:hypothetical protein
MQMPDSVKSLIRSNAPTVLAALALPPPLGLIAAGVVSVALEKYLPTNDVSDGAPNPASKISPVTIVEAIQTNQTDPQMLIDLKRAEADLQKYEAEAGIRFSELALEDKKSSRTFQADTGISTYVFFAGMSLIAVALLGLVAVILVTLNLMFNPPEIPEGSEQLAIAVFGLIGTAVGFINGIAANVVGFYWGSSQSSKDKGEELAKTTQSITDLGRAAIDQARLAPQKTQPVTEVSSSFKKIALTDGVLVPTTPAPAGILNEIIPEISAEHRYVNDGVSWQLTQKGISIDGAEVSGTAGEPTTVLNIWTRYGNICCEYAKRYGVPVELIVATIATESGGNQNARRNEPQINDESVGLMQTLVATARSALGQKNLQADHLLRPERSIEAGTAYIAQQRGVTHFDPPKVAAAYNAGSLRRDNGQANRWKMLCYPTGTGRHIDSYIAFFNDCMKVSARMNWSQHKDIPSFCQ